MPYKCLVQLRGCTDLEKIAEKFGGKVLFTKDGIDVYFEDVNDARRYLSRIRKIAKVKVKMSMKHPKIFFYSVKCYEDEVG